MRTDVEAARPEPWLKLAELAPILRMSPATLYKLRKRGVLKGIGKGRTIRYRLSEVEKQLAESAGGR